jgi:hypothetical protein
VGDRSPATATNDANWVGSWGEPLAARGVRHRGHGPRSIAAPA